MGMVVIDSRKIYWTITFINTAVSEKCSLPLCGRCNRLCRYFKIDHYHHEDAPGSNIVWYWGLCLSCMSDTVPTSLACSWLDRTLVLCPFCCSAAAGMGWGSQTWQQAKWVGGLLLLYWATYLHLCVCSPSTQTNQAKGNGTRQQQRTVFDIKISTGNLKCQNKKDYFCQNVSWDTLNKKWYLYSGLKKNITVFTCGVSGNNAFSFW